MNTWLESTGSGQCLIARSLEDDYKPSLSIIRTENLKIYDRLKFTNTLNSFLLICTTIHIRPQFLSHFNDFQHRLLLENLAQVLMFQAYILDSSPRHICPDWGLSPLSSVRPGKCQKGAWNGATAAFFNVLYIQLFITTIVWISLCRLSSGHAANNLCSSITDFYLCIMDWQSMKHA